VWYFVPHGIFRLTTGILSLFPPLTLVFKKKRSKKRKITGYRRYRGKSSLTRKIYLIIMKLSTKISGGFVDEEKETDLDKRSVFFILKKLAKTAS